MTSLPAQAAHPGVTNPTGPAVGPPTDPADPDLVRVRALSEFKAAGVPDRLGPCLVSVHAALDLLTPQQQVATVQPPLAPGWVVVELERHEAMLGIWLGAVADLTTGAVQ